MATIRHIQLLSRTLSEWEAENPVLWDRELGYDTTTRRIKFGNGVTAWKDLPYVSPDVIDVLASTSATAALSAKQGNVLFKAIPIIKNNLTTTELKVTDSSSADYSRPYALSAYQGKVLSDLIGKKADAAALTTLQNTVNSLNTALNTLQQTVNGHTTTLNTLQQTVNGHTTTLNTLQQTVNNLNTKIKQESWTFTLEDGSTVEKKVCLWSS